MPVCVGQINSQFGSLLPTIVPSEHLNASWGQMAGVSSGEGLILGKIPQEDSQVLRFKYEAFELLVIEQTKVFEHE